MAYKFKAALFDLDGTLIETVNEIADATNDTLRALGESTVLINQVRNWIGHGTRELLICALAHVRASSVGEIRDWVKLSDAFKAFDDFYLARCGTNSYLYPDVKEVLDQFKKSSIKMAIVTNKETRFTQTIIKAHALESYFDMVVCGDTLDVKKPDPKGIQICLKRFDVTLGESIFIGDSSVDALTARNAGIQVWLMPYGYNMGEPLLNAKADYLAKGFAELKRLLK